MTYLVSLSSTSYFSLSSQTLVLSSLPRTVTSGTTDLMMTMTMLRETPMMRPRSTSTRTVARKVRIQSPPSHTEMERYLVTSFSFLEICLIDECIFFIVCSHLTIPTKDARMMEARTQTGRGSKRLAREKMTASSVRLETSAVSSVLQPDRSWTRDRDSEADIGRQRKKVPTRLLTPWAMHSGLGGTWV